MSGATFLVVMATKRKNNVINRKGKGNEYRIENTSRACSERISFILLFFTTLQKDKERVMAGKRHIWLSLKFQQLT